MFARRQHQVPIYVFVAEKYFLDLDAFELGNFLENKFAFARSVGLVEERIEGAAISLVRRLILFSVLLLIVFYRLLV